MQDMKIRCVSCKGEFEFTASEQEYYQRIGLRQPKRCKPCRGKETRYLDTDAIIAFVQAVEDKKGFKRDVRLVFAHLVEETGELARAVYLHEREALVKDYPDPSDIGAELIDIIFLASYLADILRIDLNKQIPERMADIRVQYAVENKKGGGE